MGTPAASVVTATGRGSPILRTYVRSIGWSIPYDGYEVNLSQARSLALALPEVTEQPHHDKTSFRVGGRIFATATTDARWLHVMVDEPEVHAAVAADPACSELRWGNRLAGVRLDLAAAQPRLVRELLEEAWRRRAPRRAVAKHARIHGV